MFGAAPGTHEYSDAISMILSTKIIGQAWNQMIEEFGEDQPVDAECSFGKGLFENLIRNIRPSGFVFKQNSFAELRLGFGCAIEIQNKEGVWENFRGFYGELTLDAELKIIAQEQTKTFHMTGIADDLKATKIKIFKRDEA